MAVRRVIHSENVNLSQMPATRDDLNDDQWEIELCLGDLHANPVTLIYVAVRYGVITNMTRETYAELYELCMLPASNITKVSLKRFYELMSGLNYSTSRLVRLLGDETADRFRGCDIYVIFKLVCMRRQRVPYEILLSNHGVQFIRGYELKSFYPYGLDYESSTSMRELQTLIMNGVIGNELYDFIGEAYKPAIKVLSYTLDVENDYIGLHSHAGFGVTVGDVIPPLAKKFKVHFDDTSVSALAETIDRINRAFLEFVLAGKVHTVYDFNLVASSREILPDLHPLEYITWNRNYHGMKRPSVHPKYGYKIGYGHGHDSGYAGNEEHICVLNENLGRPGHIEGTLKILCMHRPRPVLVQELNNKSRLE